jgi:ABC-type transport system involved in cytochrome c biogenesis permease subunit
MAGNSKMSIHGWIAMTLAAVLTLGLGGGLMWLAFYSSRRGYDDAAQSLGEEEDR